MYKVVLVDDEAIIREGLKALIDWEECGFEVVGDSSSGSSAITLIQSVSPDLVITDIKMPVMDGLEMIRQLKSSGYNGLFIIASGYSDFEYARTAIKYGVNSYILKPIDEAVLVGELYTAKKKLMKSRNENFFIEQNSSLSKEKYLEQFVTGRFSDSDLSKYASELNENYNFKSYRIMLIHYKCSNMITNTLALLQIMVEQYAARNKFNPMYMNDKTIGILIDGSNKPESLNLYGFIKGLYDSLNITITIALGKVVCSLKDLPLSYASADKLFEKQFIYGKNGVIIEPDNSLYEQSSAELPVNEVIDRLYIAMEYNSSSDICSTLDKLMESFLISEYMEMAIKSRYVNIFVCLVEKIINANSDIDSNIFNRRNFIEEIYFKDSLTSLNESFKQQLCRISDEMINTKPDEGMIKKIIDYMQKNLSEDIKIETFAQVLHYNRAYIGKMFKQYTGEYFNTYLDKLRIEKAKEYLKQGSKVHQAAKLTGFSTVDYFNTKFKKYENISPSAYKSAVKKNM